MLRKLSVFLIISACFVLQSSVFSYFTLASIAPNLLIVVTSSFGFMRGKKSGLFTGLVCGLYMDIFIGDFIGFYALVYMYMGYINGFFHTLFFDEDVKLPMIWITLSDFGYGLIIYFFLFFLRSRFDFPYYLIHIIIPEVVYTVIITIFLYPLIRMINRKLAAYEKGSENSFV